jgi:hypothetical protein
LKFTIFCQLRVVCCKVFVAEDVYYTLDRSFSDLRDVFAIVQSCASRRSWIFEETRVNEADEYVSVFVAVVSFAMFSDLASTSPMSLSTFGT